MQHPAGTQELRHYWTTACSGCRLKPHCTTGPERRITRWEYEQVLEAVQQRLDGKFDAQEISALKDKDDLVAQVQAKYSLEPGSTRC